MRIDASGNLGVGLAGPSSYGKLAVLGNIAATDGTTVMTLRASAGTTTIGSFFNTSGSVLSFTTNPASSGEIERMRIDTAGNVGINTTSPSTFGQFSVVNGTGRFVAMSPANGGNVAQFRFDNNGAQTVNFTNLGMTAANHGMQLSWLLGTDSVTAITAGRLGVLSEGTWTATASTQNSFMQFATATSGNITERMRIDSAGNVLVGTTTSTGFQSGVAILPGTGLNTAITIAHANTAPSGNFYLGFNYNGTNIGGITQNGTTAVAYNTTSDERLKKDIVDAPSAGAMLDAIKVRSYNWKHADEPVEHGFVAQELVAVVPSAVKVGDADPTEVTDQWAVDYSKLVPLLVKEIQELRARVLALEAK
jgi:hypothetical protein